MQKITITWVRLCVVISLWFICLTFIVLFSLGLVDDRVIEVRGPTPRSGLAIYTTVEKIPMGEKVRAGTFFLNRRPTVVLFDSGASHNFMSSIYAK
jgi:hypothetical protein